MRARLRVVLACACLEVGALSGVPMRPEQIQELMHTMNQPKLAHVVPVEREQGDGPPEGEQSRTRSRPAHHGGVRAG
jgi:hypothetical protein